MNCTKVVQQHPWTQQLMSTRLCYAHLVRNSRLHDCYDYKLACQSAVLHHYLLRMQSLGYKPCNPMPRSSRMYACVSITSAVLSEDCCTCMTVTTVGSSW